MPIFGAPLREACRDGCGGVPRVVAETIAWLDAHGASRPDRTFLFPSRVRLGAGARPRRAAAVEPPRRGPERLSRGGLRRRASSSRTRASRQELDHVPSLTSAPRPRVGPFVVALPNIESSSSFLLRAVAVKPVPGLHRVPGDTRVVAECASRYDEREDAPLRGVRDARAVASVLKLYLDALPTPLLRAGPGAAAGNAPFASVAAVAETRRERGHDAALAALRSFVANSLPVCNRDALRATCAHLRRVAQAEAAAPPFRDDADNKARRNFAEATKTLAAAFGATLVGESLGSNKAVRGVVEMLLVDHDLVFGTTCPPGSFKTTVKTTVKTTAKGTNGANGATQRLTEKENAVPNADKETLCVCEKSKTTISDDLDSAVSTPPSLSCEKDIASYVDKETLDVVHGFLFDGDENVCAEADRALGGSIVSLYADENLVERASFEWLRLEKTAIKRRLRAFDVSVERSSGMKSTKEDKKHLRPLYLRLARVKRRMQIAAAEGAA